MAVLDRAIARALPAVPKPFVRAVASRYLAGSTLEDATWTVRALNERGKRATIDVLGEEITNADEAEAIARQYEEVLLEIGRRHLDSNISVKPTALGLELDPALCEENLVRLAQLAKPRGNFVRIDMEDATTTDATLGIYRSLRARGFDNVGVVLQASLRRTLDDVEALADLRPSVRICKGIYVESPELQFQDFQEVRDNFLRALAALFEAGCQVGIATHDRWLITQSKRFINEQNISRDRYEFQMLLGVRPELGDTLVAEGHHLRVYVPFGVYWYEYSLRRLQENPRVAGYIASDTITRLLRARSDSV